MKVTRSSSFLSNLAMSVITVVLHACFECWLLFLESHRSIFTVLEQLSASSTAPFATVSYANAYVFPVLKESVGNSRYETQSYTTVRFLPKKNSLCVTNSQWGILNLDLQIVLECETSG